MTVAAAAPARGAHSAGSAARRDAAANTALLAVAAFTAFLVPAQLAFGTEGLSFRIPSVVGLAGLFLALCRILATPTRSITVEPVTVALLAYGAYVAFAFGRTQFLPSLGNENGPIRALLLSLGAVGLGVLAASSLRDRRQLRTVLVFLLCGAYLSALVALGQKLFNLGYAGFFRGLPGLQTDNLGTRTANVLSGRAFGTAGHPIELSVVSVVLCAFALHMATCHPSRGGRQFHAAGSALLLIGGFLAISRSGFIALVVVLVVRFAYSAGRQRLNLAALLVVGVGLTEVLSPRSLSTLRYQLSNVGSDNSSKGRTSDYGPVLDQWRENPWFGNGYGVADAAKNRILDNAWLGQLSNGGLTAVVLLALLFLVTIGRAALWAHRSRGESGDPELHSVMGSAAAAMTGLLVSAYFFDELSFFQAQTLVFLIAGVVAAAPFGAMTSPRTRRTRRRSGLRLVPRNAPRLVRTVRAPQDV